MNQEINLLINYPKMKRNVNERADKKKAEDQVIARQFGKDFFDGERKYGYGGFSYHPKFWQPVIPTFKKHYNLTSDSILLDVGCGKGFMMHDIVELIPGITGGKRLLLSPDPLSPDVFFDPSSISFYNLPVH